MNRSKILLIAVLLLVIFFINHSAEASQVEVIKITGGTINPISAEYIVDAINSAENNHSECLVIQLDTPGGLLTSTQKIVKRMLASKVPLVVYVYPSGSGAVSAGVSITIAAHFAVMAPGTSIGAAHPVTGSPMGGNEPDSGNVMMQKATNWWASFNKSIAEKRNRNADWVEDAVKKSVSVTETEALEKNVVDFICPSMDSLLIMLDSRTVEIDDETIVLHTREAQIIYHEQGIRHKVLDLISNPSIAYFFFILAMLGIYFELSNPGAIFPGVIGGICLILFLFSVQQIPVNIAGILLIITATVLFILEIKITSYGLLTIGGIISMFIGSLMLFKSTPSLHVYLPITAILVATISTALFFIFAIGMALKAQTKKVTTGQEGIIGETGIAISNIKPEGDVKVHGEYWKAYSDQSIKKGQKIIVESIEGLQLKVIPKE